MASRRRTAEDKNTKLLREIAAIPANKQCFDCLQRGPTYINVTIGSFVCTTCSGILRGLTPPHRVKSISMTTFTPEEIEYLRSRGNEYCRYVWLGTFDTNSNSIESEVSDDQRKRDFMIQKYEKKRWYVDPEIAVKKMQSAITLRQKQDTAHSQNFNSKALPETQPLSRLLGKNSTQLVVQNNQPPPPEAWPHPVSSASAPTISTKSITQNQGSRSIDLLSELAGDSAAVNSQQVSSKISDNKKLSEELKTLKFEILNLKGNENIKDICQKENNSNISFENHPLEESTASNDGRICKSMEDKSTSEQKEELAQTLAQIKEEKSKLEAQKLVLIKNVIKQNSSNSPKCSNSVPSFCVLTTKNGVTSVPATHQLKQCSSYPDNLARSLSPLWKADPSTSTQSSPSTTNSVFENSLLSPFPVFSPQKLYDDDLPNWARTAMTVSISEDDSYNLESFASEGDNQCSEEDNLAKLKAAAEDIESRRINFCSKRK